MGFIEKDNYLYNELDDGWVWSYSDGKVTCGTEEPFSIKELEYVTNWAKNKRKWIIEVECNEDPRGRLTSFVRLDDPCVANVIVKEK